MSAAHQPRSVAPPQAEAVQLSIGPRRRFDFNYAVNGLRGLCILFVFAYHVANSGLLPAPSSALAEFTVFMFSSLRYGVELFFMISGYVIVASLRRHRTVRGFLWDRFSRIFPLWAPIHTGIFIVGATFGLKMFYGTDALDKLQIYFANLVLIPPLINSIPGTHGVSWSLSYEWLFYLFAAAAVALHKSAVSLPAAPKLASWFLWAVGIVALLLLLPRALFFIPGVAVALAEPAIRNHAQRILRWPVLSLILFLVTWRLVDVDYANPGASSVASVYGGVNALYTTVALLAGFHVFACVCVCDERQRWLRGRLMQLLGNVSYSFYLWHPIIMFLTKRLTYALVVPRYGWAMGVAFFALSSFALALPVSYLSYRLLEMRVAKAVRHFFDRRVDQTARARVTANAASADGA